MTRGRKRLHVPLLRHARSAVLGVGLGVVLAGCSSPAGTTALQRHNRSDFNDKVYPVLLRDCGFPSCHGSSERIFRVYGPGRVRLSMSDPQPGAFDKATTTEIGRTFELAMAHFNSDAPEQSLLLRKPLSVEAGGTGHQAVDSYGRDVYRSTQDSGYRILEEWVTSEEAP